jgi:hypothetical protein
VRCIQRNCALYLQLRDWSWWRLYRSVRPLIHVYRSEAEVDHSRKELEAMRVRLVAVEKERDQLQKLCSDLQNEVCVLMRLQYAI